MLVSNIATMFLVSGCSVIHACPAVAYSNTLTIQLSGETDQVAEVLVCGGSTCATEGHPEDGRLVEEAVQSPSEGTTWTASLFWLEEPLMVRVTDANGEIVAVTQIEPEWFRTGGSKGVVVPQLPMSKLSSEPLCPCRIPFAPCARVVTVEHRCTTHASMIS